MPDEASKYVDAIFTGEAEALWPQVIKDFENGKLKKSIMADCRLYQR